MEEEKKLSEKTPLEQTEERHDSSSIAQADPPVESEKTETAGGDTETAGGDTEVAGGDTETAGGDTEVAGGDTEIAADVESETPTAKPQPAPGLATDPSLETILEALLFVSPEPVPVAKLADAAGRPTTEVRAALKNLAASFAESKRAVELTELAGGFQILTRSIFNDVIQAFRKSKSIDRLSASALECLAIVAYKQPIIRAEVEAIRGVQCGPVLRGLLDRRLIRVAGRDKRPGNPILYRTTNRFLEHFGLKSLKGLPSVEELKSPSN